MTQDRALELLLTGRSALVSGPPGCGKTALLQKFVAVNQKNRRFWRPNRRLALTATTGLAANHLGGQTIQSWSGLNLAESWSPKAQARLPNHCRQQIRQTDCLIVDEVSMLSANQLDSLDQIFQQSRQNRQPFGGLQVILAGDFLQLPPVTRAGRRGQFINLAKVFKKANLSSCYLSQQYRQVGFKNRLYELLKNWRRGQLTPSDYQVLQSRLKEPPAGQSLVEVYETKAKVFNTNQAYLEKLKAPIKTYQAQTKGSKSDLRELFSQAPVSRQLNLKVGALVMVVKNDHPRGYFNGLLGRVRQLKPDRVWLATKKGQLLVRPTSWSLSRQGRQVASIYQLPLSLAWAITVHKSQGLTLEKARIDLRDAFVFGMGYVALSRLRQLDDLYLRGFNYQSLTLDPQAQQLDNYLRQRSLAAGD